MKELIKKIMVILAIMMITINSQLLLIISEAVEVAKEIVDESKINPLYEINLEKYVNYNTESGTGTLVQMDLKTGIEYEGNQEYSPLSLTGVFLNPPIIENEYPDSVEVIGKSTKATNGCDKAKDFQYIYNKENGELKIIAANKQDENGNIYRDKVEGARDEYTIIFYYGANCYNDKNIERDLKISGFMQTNIANEKETMKRAEIKQNMNVTENVSGLVSTKVITSDIYNGYMEANRQNGTQYQTEYIENIEIEVSKKELSEEMIIDTKHSFINENEEEIDTDEILYQSTKISKNQILSILGEDGWLQILDNNEEVIGEINKDTEVEESGIFEIAYEKELSKIIVKTSKPIEVGTITLQNKRAIKETMTNLDNHKICVKNIIYSVDNKEEKKEIYQFENDRLIDIKNSETRIDLEVDQLEWTNQVQNDVNFTATLMANDKKYNLFRNPVIEIKLPEEVEKIILGEVSLVYDNGLEIKDAQVVEHDNGKSIRIELEGNQSEYFVDSLVEGSKILIPATIIVKKDIGNVDSNISWMYTNEIGEVIDYEANGNENKEVDVHIESILAKQEEAKIEEMPIVSSAPEVEIQSQAEDNIQALEVKTQVILGDQVLKDGDIVHEKQIIKYSVSVTNNSSEKVTGISVEGQVPEGTIYATVDIGKYMEENYEYVLEEEVKNYTLPITEIEAGETKTEFYEVVVGELSNNITERNIANTITTKINETICSQETKNNVVKKAELEVFIRSYIGRDARNSFFYYLDITNTTDKKLNNVKIESNTLQKELSMEEATFIDEYGIDENGERISIGQIDENRKYVATIDAMEAGQKRTILIRMKASNFEDKINECPLAVTFHVSTDETDTYISNENRRMSYPEYVTVVQSLDKEGESVLPGETVEYKCIIKNESKVRTLVNITDKYSDDLEDVVVKYENYNIIVPEEDKDLKSNYTTYYDLKEEQEVNYEREEVELNVSELEKHNEFSVSMIIPAGKILEITVTGTAGEVFETTEVENYMVVSGEMIKTTSSNISKFNILLEEEDNNDDVEEDDDFQYTIEDDDEPDEPDDPDNTTSHSINGVVWIDKNEDGIRQESEETVKDITVKLYYANTNSIVVDQNNNKQIAKTNENGKYEFKNVADGNYLVLFEYDANIYTTTRFSNYGVGSNTSNAMKKEVSIDGVEKTVGVTNIIKVNKSNIENLNMGLIENGSFDLKLDKYISKISVKNNKTKTYEYDNAQLAKIEIDAKQIENTEIEIEYKIVVTNEGNTDAYVDEIIDYMPQELRFSSNQNSGWTRNVEGNLVNNSLVGQKIEVGKSKELKLIVTKKMTSQNTGTILNGAEINVSKSVQNLKDVDSVAGNKDKNEDDYSEASIIVSIKTGLVRNIILFMVGIGLVSLIILFVKKVKNKKMVTFVILMVALISVGNIVNAVNIKGGAIATGDDGRTYYCQSPGMGMCHGGNHYFSLEDRRTVYISGPNRTNNQYTNIAIKKKANGKFEQGESYIEFKGFQVEISGTKGGSETTKATFKNANTPYKITATYIPSGGDKDDRTSKNTKIVDKKFESSNRKMTFSVQFPNDATNIQVKVEVTAKEAYKITGQTQTTEIWHCDSIDGSHGGGCRSGAGNVQKMGITNSPTDIPPSYENKTVSVTWNIKNAKGNMRVIKVDKDTHKLLKLEGGETTEFIVYQKKGNTKKYISKASRYVTQFNSGFIVEEYSQKIEEAQTFSINLDGSIYFTDLQADETFEYYLQETKAKNGYDALETEVLMEIDDINVSMNTHYKRAMKYLFTTPAVRNKMYNKCLDLEENKLDKTKYIQYIYNICRKKSFEANVSDSTMNKIKKKIKETNDNLFSKEPTKGEIKVAINAIFSEKVIDIKEDGMLFDESGVDEYLSYLKDKFSKLAEGDLEAVRAYIDGYTPIVVENKKSTNGFLQIVKKDADTGEALPGAIFWIYGETEAGEQISIYSTTNANGVIIQELKEGIYTVEEVQAPRGYVLANQEKIKQENIVMSNVYTSDNPYTIQWTNKRYLDLSGYVWEDLAYIQKDENSGSIPQNGTYDGGITNNPDKLIQGITVQLIDSTGAETPRTATTNAQGKYEFLKIEVAKLQNYYVEFQYNGMSYINVTANKNIPNGSKAIEDSNRTNFNAKYETITYEENNGRIQGIAKAGNMKTYNLTYNTNTPGESKLLYGNVALYNYGYTGNTEPVTGVDNQYYIRANTSNLYGGNLTNIYSIEYIKANNITKIENINLGLQKRAQVDLSLIKDINSVKVSIGEEEAQVYKYADRYNFNLNGNRYDMSPQVKFGNKYGSMSYTRGLYPSDVFTIKDENSENKLKVEITYKIGIKNNLSGVTTTINELTDYYSNEYQSIKVGKKLEADGTIKESSRISNITQNTVGKYTKANIPANLQVNGENSIYVQLEVKPTEIVKLLEDDTEPINLDNWVEITSYSSKDKNENIYASIDKDSQPGNLNINDSTTYEDDTDKAPGLKLILQEEREVSGIVFVDDAEGITGEYSTGTIRQGNGKYEAGEETVKNVTVRMKNEEGEIAKVYNDEIKDWELAEKTTGTDGIYSIKGFLPGNYYIEFEWGDKEHKVQEYKSIVVDETSYKAKLENSKPEWYKDEFKQQYPDVEWGNNAEIRVSDALDNYTTREAIDKQTNTMTYQNKQVIENYSGFIEVDGNQEPLITRMISTTPKFKANFEYYEDIPASEEYKLVNGEIEMKGKYAVKKDEYKNHLKSIDFGMIERAKQVLKLEKEVKHVKITLPNGNTLINADVIKDANGDKTLEGEIKHTVYVPDSVANAQIKCEIDSEMIQGSNLEIEYGFKIINMSELDYNTRNYYYYGNKYTDVNKVIKLDATKVIDYLDNGISTADSRNNFNIVQQINMTNEDKKLLSDENEMKEFLKNTNRILLLEEELSKQLKPKEETTNEVKLIASKELSTTAVQEGIALDNHAEIIKIEKTGGAPIITTPGNYIPSNSETKEVDSDSAESVSIVPPTGLDSNYIAYTILAISSLGITIAGIILIKKFVLK